MKKLTNRNFAKYQIENPVNVTKEQIADSHIARGIGKEKAWEIAEHEYKYVKKFVSDKYQSEVDYYIANGEPSDSEVGKKIKSRMSHFVGRFFETLISEACIDLRQI